jgi:5-(hydroxymethyl)furfural/furfural oxidase
VGDADVIIVGAGTAGCVLASRLSQDPARRVLLVEAGVDFPPGSEPADISSLYPLSYFNPRYLWRSVSASWWAGRSPVPFAQGCLVGGGSAVMGMWAVRGFPEDYDEWQQAGASGWTWRDVLPFFIRAERDLDFAGHMHGQAGPVSIRRQDRMAWPPYCRAVAAVAQDLGLEHVSDMNAEFRDGISVLPIAATGRRVSAASAYLTPEVRARSNLRIAPGTRCARIVFDGTRVTGIETHRKQGLSTLDAPEVILAAGALHSPALLMRSGVGPRALLERHGIPMVSALSGVGENLQNHPVIPLGVYLTPSAVQPDRNGSAAFFCLRMSSAAHERSDLYFSVLNRSSWHYFGRRLATLGVMLHKPCSRGRVLITSALDEMPPRVEFALVSDPRDAQRLVKGLRTGVRILGDERLLRVGSRAGLVRQGVLARLLAHRTPGTRALDSLCSALFPLLPSLESRLFQHLLGAVSIEALAHATDEELQALLSRAVSGVFHPVGTCRMGRREDPGAVVDHLGRVYGTRGLRVVDASIMPSIPRAGTFLPTVMIAEKLSAAMASGASQTQVNTAAADAPAASAPASISPSLRCPDKDGNLPGES